MDEIKKLRKKINNVEEQIINIEGVIKGMKQLRCDPKRFYDVLGDLYFERDELYEELFLCGCRHHFNKFHRKIAEELLPVAWHTDRAVDWCFDEDEKKGLHILWREDEKL